MDGRYIFAIVILGLFFLLILVSFAFLEYARIKNNKRQAWIDEYHKNNDANTDYDNFAEDDISVVQAVQDTADEESDADEESGEEALQNIEDAFGKIDLEGIEEITGNYTEDK